MILETIFTIILMCFVQYVGHQVVGGYGNKSAFGQVTVFAFLWAIGYATLKVCGFYGIGPW